ncbi:potassium channel family protein [Blastococcus sp. SYSU D00922]
MSDPEPPAPGRRPLVLGLVRTALTVLVVLVLYAVLPLDRGFRAGGVWLVAGLAGIGVLVGWQVRAIVRAQHPALRAVEGMALSLPLFLVFFAASYVLMSGSDPSHFTEPLDRTDGVYFAVTVFATVGFGDIAPVGEAARVVTTVQMVADLVLIGLVVRLFLAAVERGRRRAADLRDAGSQHPSR